MKAEIVQEITDHSEKEWLVRVFANNERPDNKVLGIYYFWTKPECVALCKANKYPYRVYPMFDQGD